MLLFKVRHSAEIKKRARQLRTENRSFSEIQKILKVPKSTLFSWVKDLPRPLKFLNTPERLEKMREMALVANKAKYQRINDSLLTKVTNEVAKTDLEKLPKKVLLSLLYWAEGDKGDKSVINFANTDPRLHLLFVQLLRQTFNLDESRFRVRLHLHNYHHEETVKRFWSNHLKIPENQFNKTYLKERSKEKTFRKNFGGICFIKYNSVYLQRELTLFARLFADKFISKNKPL